MTRKLIRLLDIKMIIILILMLLASPILCGKNTYTICLIYSNYLCVYMNNVFLLMNYQIVSRINALLYSLITRLWEQTFYTSVYILFVGLGFIYTLIIYMSYAFFFGGIPSDAMFVTIVFMIFNLLVTLLENTIIYLQVGQKKNFIFLALPVFINFLFHISFTQLF